MIDLCYSNFEIDTMTERTVLTDHRTLVCISDLITSNLQNGTKWVRSWKKVESTSMKDKVNFWFQHEYEKHVAAKNATSIDEAFVDLHDVLMKVQTH